MFEAGLTLLELLMVVAIMSVVGAVSVPAIKDQLTSYQLRGTGREIYGAFQLARLEAVRRGLRCTLSFGGMVDGKEADCHVYVDLNRNSVWDPGEELLRSMSCPTARGVSFAGANFGQNSMGQPTLSYTPRGLSVSPSGGFGAGSVVVSNDRGHSLRIIVNATGRVRIGSP